MYNCYIQKKKNQDYAYTMKQLFCSLIFLKGNTIKYIIYLIAAPRSHGFKNEINPTATQGDSKSPQNNTSYG